MKHELILIFIQALLHAINIGLCSICKLRKGKVLNETVLHYFFKNWNFFRGWTAIMGLDVLIVEVLV